MQASLRQKDNAMTKRLQSLLEMAIVIGGLAGAPIAAVVSADHAPITVAHDARTAGLKF